MDSSSVPRKHVRTGCVSCKKRHLKCDESVPTCRNCASAKWSCEYVTPQPIRRRRRKGDAAAGVSDNLSLYQPSGAVTHNEENLFSFRYFQDATEHESYRCLGSHSWSRIALQMSYYEPAVRHAVYALGSLLNASVSYHVQESSGMLSVPGNVLQNYSASILRLNSGLTTSALPSRVMLVLCLSFVWIELLRSNVDQAITHCRGGMLIIANAGRPGHDDDIEPCLIQAFTRLHAQVQLHGNPTSALQVSASDVNSDIIFPPTFDDLDDARYSLEHISLATFHAIRRLKRLTGSSRIPQDWTSPELFDITCAIVRQKAALLEWHQACSKLLGRTNGSSQESVAAACLLEIQYISLSLMQACLEDPFEMCFDSYTNEFEQIVRLAADFFACRGADSCFKLSMDTGLLPSLWFVALKCRVPHLRVKALNLMGSCPYREGLWRRDDLIRVAKWKMAKETFDNGLPPPELRIHRETAELMVKDGSNHVISRFRQGQVEMDMVEEWDERVGATLTTMSDMI